MDGWMDGWLEERERQRATERMKSDISDPLFSLEISRGVSVD